MNNEELMDYKEAAKYLMRKESTLRHDVSRGKIPYIKMFHSVRFRKSDLDEFIKSCYVPARIKPNAKTN